MMDSLISHTYLFLYSLHNTPEHLCTHLITMCASLEKREEVIFKKYLKLCIFDRLDCRCTRFIGDECDLPKKWTRTENREFFPSTCDSYWSTVDIVCTSIWLITHRDDNLSWFPKLCLTHKKEEWYLRLRKTVEYIEIGYFWHKKIFKIHLWYQIIEKNANNIYEKSHYKERIYYKKSLTLRDFYEKYLWLFLIIWIINSLDSIDREKIWSDISTYSSLIITYFRPVIYCRNNIKWSIISEGCYDRRGIPRMRTDIHLIGNFHAGDITPVCLICLFYTYKVRCIWITKVFRCSITRSFSCRTRSNRIFLNITHDDLSSLYFHPSCFFPFDDDRIIVHEISSCFGLHTCCSSHSHTSLDICKSNLIIFHFLRSIVHDISRGKIEEWTILEIHSWSVWIDIWIICCIDTFWKIWCNTSAIVASIREWSKPESTTVRHFIHNDSIFEIGSITWSSIGWTRCIKMKNLCSCTSWKIGFDVANFELSWWHSYYLSSTTIRYSVDICHICLDQCRDINESSSRNDNWEKERFLKHKILR